jgi:NAD(P)-dependent dehydrogenase (short-subunit alcohol dehydrogenase family)
MMAVGVKSPFIACQEAIPHMVRQGGGSIINISSIRGLVAMRNGGAYDVAKAGILNLSRQVTVDFAQHGIRANTISPGWIQSDETHRQFEEDPASLGGALIPQPVRRPGRYVDIAYAALFLASDESTFVSGANLIVDGGLLAQTGFDIRQATLEAERQSSG